MENTGHGHVYARPDGIQARCGGPSMCRECATDLGRKQSEAAQGDCQCPKCGRLHRDLGFGKPPESISNPHADLMRFYGVSTVDALIEAQDKSIGRLQESLRQVAPVPIPGIPAYPVRQG